jgi:hypothetical protein
MGEFRANQSHITSFKAGTLPMINLSISKVLRQRRQMQNEGTDTNFILLLATHQSSVAQVRGQ